MAPTSGFLVIITTFLMVQAVELEPELLFLEVEGILSDVLVCVAVNIK